MASATSSKPQVDLRGLLSASRCGRYLVCCTLFLFLGFDQAWAQSTLWRSQSPDKTLYLMGSIHVLQEGHYPLPAVMEEAFAQSDLIVFEMDQAEMESPASQQLFSQKGLYQQGASLQQNIAPATFQALADHVARLQLPMAIFQPMRPAYCALVITMMEFQRLGFEPRYGLDHYFADKARRQGKETTALESAEFQINLFFNMTPQDQEKFLQQTLGELDTFAREAEAMSRAWAQGESSKLHELLTASFSDFPGLYEKLIVKRNKRWLPEIEQLLEQHQTVLVVVGAGHLVGPHSLLKFLEKQGYTFSQL
ncbi:MAG: TraB/GumN family protein [Desulfurivibrionaceae bacterium]|nr:TraB/GumN family protein [Desulfurivibrionaceae bacterium]